MNESIGRSPPSPPQSHAYTQVQVKFMNEVINCELWILQAQTGASRNGVRALRL